MAVIKTIKSFLGQKIYPQTVMKAVYDENKNRLDNVLNQGVYLEDTDEPISGDIQKVDADKLNGQPSTYYATKTYTDQKISDLSADLAKKDISNDITFNKDMSRKKVLKSGNVVSLYLMVSDTLTKDTETLICTLPSGYFWTNTQYLFPLNVNGTPCGFGYIKANGQVTFATNISTAYASSGFISFIV